jgi:hypothetical protein
MSQGELQNSNKVPRSQKQNKEKNKIKTKQNKITKIIIINRKVIKINK